MNEELDYVIPVEYTVVNEILVKAKNQADAVNQVEEMLSKHKVVGSLTEKARVLESDIICIQEEEMMEALQKDFGLEKEVTISPDGKVYEHHTHNVVAK